MLWPFNRFSTDIEMIQGGVHKLQQLLKETPTPSASPHVVEAIERETCFLVAANQSLEDSLKRLDALQALDIEINGRLTSLRDQMKKTLEEAQRALRK